jgi:hypothetical protein
LQVNTETGALLVDVGNGTFTVPGTMDLEGTVATEPATSVRATSVLTPAATSKPVSGDGGLGLAIIETTAKVVLWASAAGAYLAYNGAASSASIPIPTSPLALDCNAADLALLQMIGDGSKTVFVIQEG